jgi:hypothetical protein
MVSTGPESRVKPEKYELNQNLTHYILIKDETTNKSGVNSFLIKFITFLAENQSQTLKAKQKLMDGQADDDKDLMSIERNEIPVVSIVIKGGYNSSRLVLQQIKNSLPVVVLRGSGGLADLLAFVDNEIRDRCMNVWNADFVETYLKPELTIKIIDMFPKLGTNLLLCDTFRTRILESIRESRKEEQSFLTVIHMFDTFSCNLEKLSEYLLLALFRSKRPKHLGTEATPANLTTAKDLNLCVDWSCPEVAKQEVLSKDPTFVLSSQKRLFENSLLRTNCIDFVDLFLSQKFKIRTFITPKRVKRLFRKIHSREVCMYFRHLSPEYHLIIYLSIAVVLT